MVKKSTKNAVSAESRIKEAAHKVFLAKGFSGTTIRDVAREATTNIALVNYYFRSKQNLFDVVMAEKVQVMLGTIFPILNEPSTTLDDKVERIVASYIDFLTKNPDMPTFVLNELRKKNFVFLPKEKFDRFVRQSPFIQQLVQENKNIHPVHFLISLLGMTIFPFVARPLLMHTGLVNEQEFNKMMTERKTLIPAWIKAMRGLNVNPNMV